ncbi:MAG: V-type ATPase 116kDa subunit family protein [Oscillospiraceae bacterium]|nr:V-type ATPase 116kDa subunit family protein [Oscillospiraceae bacterium]
MIEEMKLMGVTGELEHLDEFLVACCMQGEFAPRYATHYLSGSLGYVPLKEENPYPALQARVESMAQELNMTLPAADHPSPELSLDSRAYLDTLSEQFSALREAHDKLAARKKRYEEEIAQYSHFLTLKGNIQEICQCKYVSVRFGFLPTPGYNKLQDNYAEDPFILFVPCTMEPNGCWGVYMTPCSRAQETDSIFSMLYFERVRVPDDPGTPEELIEEHRKKLEGVVRELEENSQESRRLWQDNLEKVDTLYDTIRYLSAAYLLRRYAAVKRGYFVFVGWVPTARVEAVSGRAEQIPSIKVAEDNPDSVGPHTPPIKLKNRWWARPFEYFIKMYGLPAYGETDVTAFVAITYTLLFGIMFGDVGQGLVLMLLSVWMWKRKKAPLFLLMIPCGIASCLSGFVFGSFFGYENALDPLYHAVGLSAKPVSIMESINGILLFAIFTGVTLVVVSMLLNVYSNLKRRKFGSALFDTNGVCGMVTYLAGVDLCYAFMGGNPPVPSGAAAAVLAGGLLILLMQGILAPLVNGERWKPANGWGEYFMESVFETIECVLSYLSNTISFLRVGAFVIVHASMMMVVFTLAGDPANIVVVAIGNIVVIALEALLSGIQGIRLEFYEMFSRCYQGGGEPFDGFDIHKSLEHESSTVYRKAQLSEKT